MKNKQLTDNELAMLRRIRDCEFHDGREPIDDPVWLSTVATSHADGGTITALQKKGLVRVEIFDNRIDDTVCLTYAGGTYLMLEPKEGTE